MSTETLPRRPLRLLHMLYANGKSATMHSLSVKQTELAEQLGISRQALSSHLRKLRRNGYIRTGRGFIDVTEKGLAILEISTNPAFVLIKVSPTKRDATCQKLQEFPIQQIFRVKGDMDAVLVVELEKLDEAHQKLSSIDAIEEMKFYVPIEALK
jgi:DNA-binding Lrp family transcriptional regulator